MGGYSRGGNTGDNLAQNGFSWGSSGGTKLADALAYIVKCNTLYSSEFDSCDNLQSIFLTDKSGDVINACGSVFFSGKIQYGEYGYQTEYRTYFVYTPAGAEGILDFSEYTENFYFNAGYFEGRRKVEGIIFPSRLNLTPGFKDCPSLASLKRKDNTSDRDGILYNGSYCVAVPPAYRESLTLNGGISEKALAYAEIGELTLSGDDYSNTGLVREDSFIGFRGNVTVTKWLRRGSPDLLFKALGEADSENYTLKCDPANKEKAAKYWKGKTEDNDLHIESIERGFNTLTVTFGGKPELYGRYTEVTNGKYGTGTKVDSSGRVWCISGLYVDYTDNVIKAGYEMETDGDSVWQWDYFFFETPELPERTFTVNLLDVKQCSVRFSVSSSDNTLTDKDYGSLNVICAGASSERLTAREFLMKNLEPGQSFTIRVYNPYVYEGVERTESLLLAEREVTTKKLTVRYRVTAGQVTATLDELELVNPDESFGDSRPYKWYVSNGLGGAGLDEKVMISRRANEESRDVYIYFSGTEMSMRLGTVRLKPFVQTPIVTPTGFETAIEHGDAKDVRVKWSYKGSGESEVEFVNGASTGHKPNSSADLGYEIHYRIPGDGRERNFSGSFPVGFPALTLKTLQPKVTGTGTAIVCAETNMAEYEMGGGFQWKKYDAPASLTPTEGYALVIGNEMQGAIKNLSTANYYNVRAFYRAGDGTEFFGDWVTFDPSDVSYFDPTVHTYRAIDVSSNAARLRGAVLQGSDEIEEQGFEYAVSGADARGRIVSKAPLAPSGVMTVQGSGQMMECELTGLEPETSYVYRSYVRTTKGESFYGETLEFTTDTDPASGVEVVEVSPTGRTLMGRYNLQGLPVGEGARGLVIEVYSEGSSRKVLLK